MKNCAPILLFVYNRPRHLKKVVDALKINRLAEESDLFIFSDFAKNNESTENVHNVRKYIRTISGFKSVNIIEREQNFGLAKSIITGVTEMLKQFNQVIILEDDLLTSEHFLMYMNQALELYEHDDNVISIHGYIYPLEQKLPETFFLRGADCWGWATWKRGWDLFEPDAEKLLNELYEKKLDQEFDFNGAARNIKMLKQQIKGDIDSWAIRWHASAFLKNKLTLYPGRSLVQNIGMGQQSTHTKKTNAYDVELSSSPIRVEKIEVKENEFVKKELEKYFRKVNRNIIQKLADTFFKSKK